VTLRDDLLPDIDDLRGIPEELGFRRYQVTLRKRTWSGGEPGKGAPTNTDTHLKPAPFVRRVTAREVAESGGTYQAGDFRIDRITPAFNDAVAGLTGGFAPGQLRLTVTQLSDDAIVVLTGDEGEIACTLVEVRFDRAFRYSLVVRQRRSGG
jgi:hypothetical protein